MLFEDLVLFSTGIVIVDMDIQHKVGDASDLQSGGGPAGASGDHRNGRGGRGGRVIKRFFG